MHGSLIGPVVCDSQRHANCQTVTPNATQILFPVKPTRAMPKFKPVWQGRQFDFTLRYYTYVGNNQSCCSDERDAMGTVSFLFIAIGNVRLISESSHIPTSKKASHFFTQ
jgi:hypothetical protein